MKSPLSGAMLTCFQECYQCPQEIYSDSIQVVDWSVLPGTETSELKPGVHGYIKRVASRQRNSKMKIPTTQGWITITSLRYEPQESKNQALSFFSVGHKKLNLQIITCLRKKSSSSLTHEGSIFKPMINAALSTWQHIMEILPGSKRESLYEAALHALHC